jgi:AraC-like DNA-binding protein
MSVEVSDRLKYDPSDIRQFFPDINIRLHCCRYWLLKEWECINMAFPFWRMYFNTFGSASIEYKGVITHLGSDHILIVPPNTSFSSSLKGRPRSDMNESIVGKKIESENEVFEIGNNATTDHLFIHFNLGIPYDLIDPGVYTFSTQGRMYLLNEIKKFCIAGENVFSFNICAIINCLILGLLTEVPQEKWKTPKLDKRVSNALVFIDKHIGERLTNKMLSDKANMVENSFARLFRENTGTSIQQYIKRKRIDKALIMLHHSTTGIEEIACNCGFSDRFHFSKVFKELMEISPVSYKKQLIF